MAIRALRSGRGDRRQLRLLRHLRQPHHLPDGAPGPVQRLRRRRRQRLVGDGKPHAPARRIPRGRIPGPIQINHPRMLTLRPGVWHADSVVHGASAAPCCLLALAQRQQPATASGPAGGLLLRLPLPHRPRPGRRQALRPRLRRRPVRRQPPRRARLPGLPLQLVVLLHGHRHLRRRLRRRIHPGQRRLGRRLRSPLRHRARCIRRLPHGHPHLPPLPTQEEAATKGGGGGAAAAEQGHGQQRAPPASPHLGYQPRLRRRVRADHDPLQQAGPHPGPPHRGSHPAPARRAADARPRQHPALRPRLRLRHRAGAPLGHRQPLRTDHAAARWRRHGHVPGRGVRRRARGGAPPRHGKGARPGGPAGGHRAHDLGMDGAAVRHDGGGRRARRRRPAGALLRPDARRPPQPGAGALPQRHGHRGIHQQPAHLHHRRHHIQGRPGQLVRGQPQPRAPRLLLLAARGDQRPGARALPRLRKILRLQPPTPSY